MKLYSNCSEWVGKLNNRKYKDVYTEYIDDDGKKQKELEEQDNDIEIDTSMFPNGGLTQAVDCIKKGFDIDDIEWDNQGGGADGDYLNKIFEFGRKIVNSGVKLDSEGIEMIDGILWGGGDDIKEDEMLKVFSKMGQGDVDDFALKLVEMDNVFGKTLLKLKMLKEETKHKIEKILVANRLTGKNEG